MTINGNKLQSSETRVRFIDQILTLTIYFSVCSSCSGVFFSDYLYIVKSQMLFLMSPSMLFICTPCCFLTPDLIYLSLRLPSYRVNLIFSTCFQSDPIVNPRYQKDQPTNF